MLKIKKVITKTLLNKELSQSDFLLIKKMPLDINNTKQNTNKIALHYLNKQFSAFAAENYKSTNIRLKYPLYFLLFKDSNRFYDYINKPPKIFQTSVLFQIKNYYLLNLFSQLKLFNSDIIFSHNKKILSWFSLLYFLLKKKK